MYYRPITRFNLLREIGRIIFKLQEEKLMSQEKINMQNLWMKPLEIGFVRNGYIDNFELNYEDYLTEFINHSRFVTDNGNKIFTKIEEQAHSECDVINGKYQLDYKLFIDKKTMENLYYYSEKISVDKNGTVTISTSRKQGTYRRYHLVSIFKDLLAEDIKKIENLEKLQLDELQKLVKEYIPKMKVDKNILYFLPFNLYFKGVIMGKEVLRYLADQLSKDLKGLLEYRNSQINNKDTYLCFLSKGNMVFLKYEGKLTLYDVVGIEKSELFSQIENIYDWWGNKFWEE